MKNEKGNDVESPTLKYGAPNYDRNDYLPSQTSKREETSDMGQYVPDDDASKTVRFLKEFQAKSSVEEETSDMWKYITDRDAGEIVRSLNQFQAERSVEFGKFIAEMNVQIHTMIIDGFDYLDTLHRTTYPYLMALYANDPIAREFMKKVDIPGLNEYVSDIRDNFKYGDLGWLYDYFDDNDLDDLYAFLMNMHEEHQNPQAQNDEEDEEYIQEELLLQDYFEKASTGDLHDLYVLCSYQRTISFVAIYLNNLVLAIDKQKNHRQ